MFDSIARAELESEYNGYHDYMSEAYGPTADDAAEFARREIEEHENEFQGPAKPAHLDPDLDEQGDIPF